MNNGFIIGFIIAVAVTLCITILKPNNYNQSPVSTKSQAETYQDEFKELKKICLDGTLYWKGYNPQKGYLAPVINLKTNDRDKYVPCE